MFEGFTPEGVEFLLDIRFNNNREWFMPRKDIYVKQVYEPMRQLSQELYQFVRQKRPDYDLTHKTSRIYRDARRLHGSGPYRDHMWLGIEPPNEEWVDLPSMWFGLSGDYWTAGMGYPARPATMAKLRARMTRDPRSFEKLLRRLSGQDTYKIEIESYKKPRGQAPTKRLEPWFSAKRFWVERSEDISPLLYSRELVGELERGIELLLPWVDYFITLASDKEADTI